ncbi:MAG TPA: Imm1 family immunity protein [Pseudonocardiaceae bacterium]|nr:Imm1 family immunity protein [Pseudonocardiaceae bacterium]
MRELLQDPFPDYPQVHASSFFYVTDEPIRRGQWPRRWMRVGFHDGFGGALFVDQTVPDRGDWSWAALAAEPMADAPTVYFDQDGDVAFPPGAVMPVDQLRAVVLEWVETGERPRSVEWTPINALVWRLDESGRVVVRSAA